MSSIQLAPSILSADLGHLADHVQAVEAAGADTFVVGSAVFESRDCRTSVTRLKELTEQAIRKI